MLATLTDRRDFGRDWLLERKFDGERCVARKRGDDVRLESRTGKDLTATYPEVRAALLMQRARELLLDGEVVAYEGEQTSFSRLQQRLGTTRPTPEQMAAYPVVYCVFDMLDIDGEVLMHRPLEERRARLTREVRPSAALQLSKAWRDNAQRRFDDACRAGWEGLIAKRAAAPYVPGRSKDWLKLKCVWEQEFVIGGYTDPTGSRTDFGAARRLSRGRHAPVRREGRHRIYRGEAPRSRRAAALSGDIGAAVHGRETDSARHALDAARTGRPDRLRRMDERWPAPAAAIPGAARRQATGRGNSGAASMRPCSEGRSEVERLKPAQAAGRHGR